MWILRHAGVSDEPPFRSTTLPMLYFQSEAFKPAKKFLSPIFFQGQLYSWLRQESNGDFGVKPVTWYKISFVAFTLFRRKFREKFPTKFPRKFRTS